MRQKIFAFALGLALSGAGAVFAASIGGATGGVQYVQGFAKEVSFSTATVQAVAATDVGNYRYVSVHIVSQGGSSTVTFQGSNDNANWTSVSLMSGGATSGSSWSSSTVATGIFHGAIPARYFRLNVTGIASGTTSGVIEFYALPATTPPGGMQGVVSNGSTANGNPLRVAGVYTNNANQNAFSTGQLGDLNIDPAGNLRTAPQRPTATDILDGFQSFTSTTGATTLVTVPAGRTWVGVLGASAACDNAAVTGTAECKARAVFSTAGASVTPAAGNWWACDARGAANAGTSATGSQGNNACGPHPFTVVAPAGNSVTVQVATTQAGSNSQVDASATGVLQ